MPSLLASDVDFDVPNEIASLSCGKKLSISAGGDRKKLRRLSSMARHFDQQLTLLTASL